MNGKNAPAATVAEFLKEWNGIPLWQIELPQFEGAEAHAWDARNVANLRRFIMETRDEYTIDEAADLLAIDPALVVLEVCNRDAQAAVHYLSAGRGISREDVFSTATRRALWDAQTLTLAFRDDPRLMDGGGPSDVKERGRVDK
ncbi:MAG: hypothetical protein WA208_20725 [Thermoanaerobaculia bacterium]